METNLYPHLRELTGLPLTTQPLEYLDLCNFIYWSTVSKLPLNFTLTDEQFTLVHLCSELPTYSGYAAYPEQIYLPVWQFM